MAHPSPLSNLIAEIYPIIASHLPLSLTPPTLLSLALTNRHISEIVLPILYSRLILKNEDDALKMIHRLLAEPDLGKSVRELHILSDLSLVTLHGKNPFDVVTGLTKVISGGFIPFMHTLDLHLSSGWPESSRVLRTDFLVDLRKNCPRLRGLILRGVTVIDADVSKNPCLTWGTPGLPVRRSVLCSCLLIARKDVTNLTLNLVKFTFTYEKFFKKLSSLSYNLHTLNLRGFLGPCTTDTSLFKLTFPNLLSLTLAGFVTHISREATTFWVRHPTLEYLDISPSLKWFPDNFVTSPGFLPNLKHLKVIHNGIQ